MHSKFLLPYISSPSRVTPRSQTLIDNIFSNKIEVESFFGNITTIISDHYAQFLLLKSNSLPKGQKERKLIPDYKKIDKKTFETELKSTNWNQILKLNLGSTNDSFEIFFEIFNKILDKHAPLRKLSIQEEKRKSKTGITPGILTSIKNKNKLYRKYIRAKDPCRKTILHNEFKKYRNQIDKIIKSSKVLKYQRFFENNKLNVYKTWTGIKEITNVSAKQRQNISGIANDNNIINNPKDIVEYLNKHFCNIAETIETEIPPSKQTFQDYLKNPTRNTLSINPLTKEEIQQEIKLLRNNKAKGPQIIPTKFFKTFDKVLSEPLTKLINLSFAKGVSPNVLKIAQVLPTFKKGDKADKNNYRPISLISNVSKILEKLTYKRLYSFLEGNNSFYPFQSGLIIQQIVHLLKLLNKFEKHVTKVSLLAGYTLISKKLLTQ